MKILLGNLIYAIAVVYFILPSGAITGGGTGLALVIRHFFSVPITVTVAVLNVSMFLLGAIALGKKFALSTLVSTVFYPVALYGVEILEHHTGRMTNDPFLLVLFGGILTGVAFGIVFRTGASTGGMDIPPLVINRYTGISLSALLYGFDVLILIMQSIFSNGEKILYGILLVCIYSILLDKFLVIGKMQIQVVIISKESERIKEEIQKRLDRGTTVFHAEGGYTGEISRVVLTVINKRQLFALKELIPSVDPNAFIMVSECSEVSGRGFSKDKVYQ